MKVILCGHQWAACEALRQLITKKHRVYVYTHVNQYFQPSLINLCKKNKIKYTTKKNSILNLPFNPDMICSIFYKYKVPQEVLNISKGKALNLHPSLLPKYRGSSSSAWAILNNEKFVGFTYHYMNSKFDNGRIILQKKIKMNNFDLNFTLFYRIMFESMKYFLTAIQNVKRKIKGKKQVGKFSYFFKGPPFKGKINPKWSFSKKERFIRSMIFPSMPPATLNKRKIRRIEEL